MGDKSSIEWTDATWNPTVGCSLVSPGCTNCYAMKVAHRLARMPAQREHYAGMTQDSKGGPVWTGKVRLIEKALDRPLHWTRPRRIFVNSMSDLFHESLPDAAIDKVFAVMALAPQHTFQVLTKRAERMRGYVSAMDREPSIAQRMVDALGIARTNLVAVDWPLPNVWLGVSVEDQPRADERIPHLLGAPAVVRFLSCEPLLGPVNLRRIKTHGGWYDALAGWRDVRESPAPEGCLNWVIAGGESGRGARRFDVEWARSILAQCKAADVPCFMKQLGADPWFGPTKYGQASGRHIKDRKGGDWSEWPEDLRVREFPR